MDGEILGSSWSVTCRRVPAENKIGVKKPFFVSDFFKLSGSQGRAHARFHTITTGTRWRGPIDGEPDACMNRFWQKFGPLFRKFSSSVKILFWLQVDGSSEERKFFECLLWSEQHIGTKFWKFFRTYYPNFGNFICYIRGVLWGESLATEYL